MSDSSNGPGNTYIRLCKALGKVESDPEQARVRARNLRLIEAEIRDIEKKTRIMELTSSSDQKLVRKLLEKRKTLAKLEKIQDQRDFQRAMRITGMGLRVEEVIRFASVSAIITLFLALAVSLILGIWLNLDMFMILTIVLGASISIPLIIFMFILNYPERLARDMELEAFGSAPEIVNYMVMSMELSPSIDRALQFAADNAQGPMASELRALVWKIQNREYASTEEALANYAIELEGLNEELRSAIYNILSASKESSNDTMRASLRRASELVLTGTRQRVEEFSASLGMPATVLFALGILLPMIIGSLLPMVSMGGFDFGENAQVQDDWLPSFAMSVILMNLVFPAFAFFYARSILGRRPGIHSFAMETGDSNFKRRFPVALFIVIVSIGISWVFGNYMTFWGIEWSISALIVLPGVALAIGYLLGSDGYKKDSVHELEKLEDQMPDMLFQLGSRLTEGKAIERALEDVAQSMDGTEVGNFLSKLIGKLRRSGMGLEELLFSGESGILTNHPSRKLKATMRLVIESSEKNPEIAGTMLMSMSNHMRELANTDKDMRVKLRSTIESMRSTALFFAPVIMGVTVGLYRLLSQTFGEMNGAQAMPESYFIMVMGLYLLMTVAIIISFCSGIENGKGKWKPDVAVALPVSAIIFSVTSLGALMAFG